MLNQKDFNFSRKCNHFYNYCLSIHKTNGDIVCYYCGKLLINDKDPKFKGSY